MCAYTLFSAGDSNETFKSKFRGFRNGTQPQLVRISGGFKWHTLWFYFHLILFTAIIEGRFLFVRILTLLKAKGNAYELYLTIYLSQSQSKDRLKNQHPTHSNYSLVQVLQIFLNSVYRYSRIAILRGSYNETNFSRIFFDFFLKYESIERPFQQFPPSLWQYKSNRNPAVMLFRSRRNGIFARTCQEVYSIVEPWYSDSMVTQVQVHTGAMKWVVWSA